LRNLRKQNSKSSLQEKLIYNSLFGFRMKQNDARHHLFDNLDDEKKIEFTEDDL
jgi:hypothetical protein